jgi:chromosome segregation ATPase
VSKNIHLSEVLEDYEKEILKYKGQIAQRSISEQSIHFEQDKSFSLNDTSISIKQHETSNVSLYDDLLKLTHSREAEIHNLHSKLSIQSSKILSLKKQLEEASNQLSLKDDQLASYSKQIQDLQTFQHSIIKSPSTRYSLKDLSLQDAESDQKLNEYRRRSCIMNNLESPESFKLYPEMLTSSFHSKVTRLDIDPFCLESDMKGTILSPIKSVNCPSDFDSEVKEREISTIKEKPKRFWDTLDSVQK